MLTTVVHVRHPHDVYIGRPSIWGNPFIIGEHGTREEVIKKFQVWIHTQDQLMEAIATLRGKRLACYCHPLSCHGDVLAELANRGEM